ncbi:MAG: hypothetical protein HY698_17580 [Deltaproteobacteria bacterium]|nr:hypothetical protein [Deltaproteobacteria bacterium]
MKSLVVWMAVLSSAVPGTSLAHALDLRVRRIPEKATLAMRAEYAAQPPAPRTEPPRHPNEVRYAPLPQDLRDLEHRTILRVQLGYGIDQGDIRRPSGTAPAPELRETRLYTTGDLVAGTQGILTPSLATYLAGNMFVQNGTPRASSIPSVFDAAASESTFLLRSAYWEIRDLGPRWLSPLRLRSGRQFRHGLGLLHFDGLLAAYETKPVDVVLIAGDRVSTYGRGSDGFQPLSAAAMKVTGASIALRLHSLVRLPLGASLDLLSVGPHAHRQAVLSAWPSRTTSVTATARFMDGDLARFHLGARARVGEKALLSAELEERRSHDWMYDLFLTRPQAGDETPRLRLYLGPVVPHLRVVSRAGTVLFGNWDVLVGAGATYAHGDPDGSAFWPSSVEVTGGVSARFRGGLSAGVEAELRRFYRPEVIAAATLAPTAAWGEKGQAQVLAEVRHSLGPKRFAAGGQVYLRHYAEHIPRLPPGAPTLRMGDHLRLGGRFRLEGWVGRAIRTVVEYDVTGEIEDLAPELSGLQTLRIVAEASF